MPGSTVHVVGAGLAGLSAATGLAAQGWRVHLYEAAPQAGGRCRSYVDQVLGETVDNGNHVILSGNQAALDYLQRIGSRDRFSGSEQARFDFFDLGSGAQWQLRPSRGRLPWWVLDPQRRVPGTKPLDYLGLLRLRLARTDTTIGATMTCDGLLYERLWRPLLLAALNTEPAEASAHLANAVVQQTLGRGESACRPMIARDGLSSALVDPALDYLARRGATVGYGRRLRSLVTEDDRVRSLLFGDGRVDLGPDDNVILAVPAPIAAGIVPGLPVPIEHRSILNAHFLTEPPPGLPLMLGVIGGDVEWIFAYPGRLSTTTSAADGLMDSPRDLLAERLWAEVCAATGLRGPIPRWQIVKERRATFAALPAENARRPHAVTRWSNLALAGDYTATGLPATIEGAIRSGATAAATLARGRQAPSTADQGFRKAARS